MQYHPPSGSTDPNAPFVGKNVAAGLLGSKVPPGAAEYPQREIVNAVSLSGQTPTDTDLNQLTRAIRGGQLDFSLDTGTADALAATVSLAHTQIKAGLPFTVLKGPAANTTATPKLTIQGPSGANPLTQPIVKASGAPLSPGDLPAGAMLSLRSDGAAFRLLSLLTISDVLALTAQTPAAKNLVSKSVAGTYSFTVPAGVYWVYGTCVGGGAGGSGGTTSNPSTAGAGGGAGGTAAGWLAVTPGQVITYVVGSGSPGVAYQASSAAGGTSSIGANMQATGGGGTGNNGTAGGYGGAGSGGQINIFGGNGGDGNGFTANAPGGAGGASSLGGGGRTGSQNGAAANGRAPGSGGGGIYFNGGGNGGNGADGFVSFQY